MTHLQSCKNNKMHHATLTDRESRAFWCISKLIRSWKQVSSLERHVHTIFNTMYKMDSSSRQIWHTNIKDYTLKTFIKSPHYCAIIYRGIKNRAAMKGDGQSIKISTQRCSKVLKSNQELIESVSRGHAYSWGFFFYCRKIIQSIDTGRVSIKRKALTFTLHLLHHLTFLKIAVACVNATNSNWIHQMLQSLQSCGAVTSIKDTSSRSN